MADSALTKTKRKLPLSSQQDMVNLLRKNPFPKYFWEHLLSLYVLKGKTQVAAYFAWYPPYSFTEST